MAVFNFFFLLPNAEYSKEQVPGLGGQIVLCASDAIRMEFLQQRWEGSWIPKALAFLFGSGLQGAELGVGSTPINRRRNEFFSLEGKSMLGLLSFGFGWMPKRTEWLPLVFSGGESC